MLALRLFILALIVLLTGCASWYAKVQPGFDWSQVSTVTLQGPENNMYGDLLAVAADELVGMGYEVLSGDVPIAQVRVHFTVGEGLDIDETGHRFMRPKSLHVRFYDTSDQSLVAENSYFLLSSEDPSQGVKALIDGIRKKQSQRPLRASSEKTSTPAVAPAESEPPPLTAEPTTEEPESSYPIEEPSPWLPRFKSWGFDEWGQ
ncbi:hypothetical protein [Desulfuromonas sp. AOP6]|uniref:hypothetical protein n=1 Tax=Desulfuromonas sp. AOP6 TaxID=1566351 RepID=UPI001278F9B8|nr:hypothetical protein [Desulfuromonas sp. AOP6]BCA80498.1 hypothetical protein AOP6_2285 [Desulfuromonas sp. AOP6]